MDIQRRLDELPHLAVALRAFLGGSTKAAYESKVAATREPAVPLNLHVVVLIEDIDDAYGFAGGYKVQDLIRLPAQEFRVWVKGVEQRVFLDGPDRALRIRRVHERVSDAVGLAPVWQRRAAPCPECSLPTLGQWGGSSIVQCGSGDCGLSMTVTEYEKYCLEKANESKRRRSSP